MEISEYHVNGLKKLLYHIADDLLILGHRNSEWTGLGPILEEDIAFSSMAQDKIGQSLAIYNILQEMGEQEPDIVAFTRNANQFHCCQLVEYPIGEYDFSLMRHFLYDHAELLRFEMLAESIFEPLAMVCKKFKGEVKFHVLHANTWIKQLGNGTEESNQRMQAALNTVFPLALSMFETNEYEDALNEVGIFKGETALKESWLQKISPILQEAGLQIPNNSDDTSAYGGRIGTHTEYLQPLLDEMTEVFSIDPSADW